ncbi:MAG: peptidylprolyl isomerase [Alphaproteobacteria bacterium]|nr:peptidylprolyl isomerase [Alphaproteobacteria bacterium]
MVLALVLALAATTAAVLTATPAAAQNVVLMVNGEPVTNMDIDQMIKYGARLEQKSYSRQDAINQIIDDKVKIKEGKKYGIDLTFSNVEELYGDWASQRSLTAEQANQRLEAIGLRPETLKNRLKALQVWGNLVRGRYKEELNVSDRDVIEAMGPDGGAMQIEGYEYKLQQVVLLVPRGSGEAYYATRRKEAENYRNRVQSCDEANALFRSTPNATIGEVQTKTSSDFPSAVASLRRILDTTPIGHLTAPDVTRQGISMFVICSRTPTRIDTPKKRELRNKLLTDKYNRISTRYLRELRNAAMIEKR